MKKRQVGLMVFGFLFFVLLSFGLSWAQNPPTMLIVVRGMDDSLWKMTCDEGSCSPFSSFPGLLAYQPSVTWDEATQEWVVVGTASDNTIWMSTFNKQGNFNDDWHSLPGLTPSPAGVSSSLYKMGGDIKTDRWLNSDTNTFIGVGVAGAGNLTHSSSIEGWYNTAFGYQSLYSNTTGYRNTASGTAALGSNTTGYHNTASGAFALNSNTTGYYNSASGSDALFSNTEGYRNTASGSAALYSNTTGSNNTASGMWALASNTTGYRNTANGAEALYTNTTGADNTASGNRALFDNTTGYNNTASGGWALYQNTTGYSNTASGIYALYSNTEGTYNIGIGVDALNSNTTGSHNTAIGAGAGYNATAGNYNIYIGSDVYGIAGESNVIRIGSGQAQTYIAGIYGASSGSGSAVYVNSNGQLGTGTSSRRFKEDIKDMGEASSRLMNLRPVTFRYKNEIDKEGRTLQYGLIAEEVAEVYPELVHYEKDGEPFTVRYHELSPMLLNEVQKQGEQIKKLNRALDEKDVRIQKLEKVLEAVQERMALIESPTSTIASK